MGQIIAASTLQRVQDAHDKAEPSRRRPLRSHVARCSHLPIPVHNHPNVTRTLIAETVPLERVAKLTFARPAVSVERIE